MRQHWPKCDVSDALHALCRGVELIVDNDSSSFVGLDADRLKVQALGDRPTPDSDKDDVGFKLPISADPEEVLAHGLLLATLCRVDIQLYNVAVPLGADDLRVKLEFKALLLQDPLELLPE